MKKYRDSSKRFIVWLLIYSHFLVGCVANNPQTGMVKTGPEMSSTYEQQAQAVIPAAAVTKLDVIIPVFDPGLSDKSINYEEEGIWPELRRAEANRFAYKLKQALDQSREFGAVRVTPDSTATGDLYVMGTIEESDGEDVKFRLELVDISGKQWFSKSFDHTVKEGFYKNYRTYGTDPYDPVFDKAAAEIIEELRDKENAELAELKKIAELRFGASFNDQAFMQYMSTEDKYYKVTSLPSDNDPMLERVNAIRVREQLFIDNLQQNYASFSGNMNDSYLKWQEASFTEKQLREQAKRNSIFKAIGGALLIGLSIAAAVSSNNSSGNYDLGDTATATAAVVGGAAGAWMLSDSFKSAQEAKLHKQALDELGESINIEMAPQVMTFEEETVELTGNVQDQFAQWRAFLKRMYEQEATPTTEL